MMDVINPPNGELSNRVVKTIAAIRRLYYRKFYL